MGTGRTENSIKATISNLILQIVTIFMSFAVRTVFIYKLGEVYLGLNGLFSNILGVLSLAELGVGTAITFYLYKPAAEGNIERLKSLMHLYNYCYKIIGGLIFVIGLLVVPFLPRLINFDAALNINIYVIYILYLLNTVSSYFMFAYRRATFIAFQQLYKLGIMDTFLKIISSIMIICVLFVTGDFILYLIINITTTLFSNLCVGYKTGKMFPWLNDKKYNKIDKKEIKGIFKNVYAVFVFNIGSSLLMSTDNMIISFFCGTAVVGFYSNYSLISGSVTTAYNTILNSILPSVGNLNTEGNDAKEIKMIDNLSMLNAWILNFGAVALMILLNPFILLWTTKSGNTGYVLGEPIAIVTGFNLWLMWYMQIIGQFKNTKGLFQYGKYIQCIEGIVNIILSIFFAKIGGLFGIIVATSISIIFVGFIPYPHFLYKYGYNKSAIDFLRKTFVNFILLWISFGISKLFVMLIPKVNIVSFIYYICICLVVPNLVFYLYYRKKEEFIFAKNIINRIILR